MAGYNEDDCRATLALRDWLEERRLSWPNGWARACRARSSPRKPDAAEDPEVTRIRAALLAGVPAEPSGQTSEQQARALLADLLDWHRREAKPAWWRYFYLRTLEPRRTRSASRTRWAA